MTTRGEQAVRGGAPGAFGEGPNCLNALRLIFALLVVLSHAYALGGFGAGPHIGNTSIATLSVYGFFAISGYLVTRSAARSSPARFAWHRALRVLPGLWVCLLVTAFVIAPLTAGWNPTDAVRYVLANAGVLTVQRGIGSTLDTTPITDAWNGSLWTLVHEVGCYLLVAGLAAAGLLRRRVLMAVAYAVTAVALAGHAVPNDLLYQSFQGSVLADFVNFAMVFFGGSLLYLFRDVVPDALPVATVSAALTAACLLAMSTPAPLVGLPLAYTVMWLGSHAPLRRLAATHDLSYGVYIYAFPVQQVLADRLLDDLGLISYFVLAAGGAAALACASWHFVERPALRLKHRDLQRRGLPRRNVVPA